MATIKAYTDLSQSKTLSKILPLESADMGWNVFIDGTTRILPINDWDLVKDGSGNVKFYHAWSLVALLGVLPNANILLKGFDKIYDLTNSGGEIARADNPIDACYELILKLRKLKML